MKLATSLAAALGIAAVAFFADAPRSARADDDFSTQFVVTATQSGGKLNINIKPANDSVYVNSEYPLKIALTAKDGGTLGKAELTKDDGKYVPSDHEGKAKSVTFSVDSSKGASGDGKLVMCKVDACGNPTKFHFDSK
jgi:hypothetical protein